MDQEGTRPQGARIPKPLDIAAMWDLDIDAEIFADAVFNWEDGKPIPDWMGKATMRRAIRGELLFRRCREQTERLDLEAATMERWLDTREAQLFRSRDYYAGRSAFHVGRAV